MVCDNTKKVLILDWNSKVGFMDMFPLVWQTIVVNDCAESALVITSPSLMLSQIIASVSDSIQHLMNE